MEHSSSENIAGALKLLEEAARQKKDELRAAMSDKNTHLRSLIVESEASLMNTLSTAKDHAVEATAQAREAGAQKACELASGVNRGVHQNPWPYIAGSAAAGMLLACLLGRGRK